MFLLQTFLDQRGEDYDDCKSYDNLVRCLLMLHPCTITDLMNQCQHLTHAMCLQVLRAQECEYVSGAATKPSDTAQVSPTLTQHVPSCMQLGHP